MTEVLERGDIWFQVLPKVRGPDDPEPEEPRSLDDVQRLYLVLHSAGRFRMLAVGRKRLPEKGERFWGYVERVSSDPDDVAAELAPMRYQTRTRGVRYRPAARCAGEGGYALVRHDDHVHLAYQLARPRELGDLHLALRLLPSGSYILAVFQWKLEDGWRDDRRFAEATPALLDRDGVELVLIGTDEEPEPSLGISLA